MPTTLFASWGFADQRTFQLRVEPGAVDWDRLARLDAIGADVADGRHDAAGRRRHARRRGGRARAYRALLTTAAFALTSAAAARFFGGGLRGVAGTAGIGWPRGIAALTGRVPGSPTCSSRWPRRWRRSWP